MKERRTQSYARGRDHRRSPHADNLSEGENVSREPQQPKKSLALRPRSHPEQSSYRKACCFVDKNEEQPTAVLSVWEQSGMLIVGSRVVAQPSLYVWACMAGCSLLASL